jgi:hypothetical protein
VTDAWCIQIEDRQPRPGPAPLQPHLRRCHRCHGTTITCRPSQRSLVLPLSLGASHLSPTAVAPPMHVTPSSILPASHRQVVTLHSPSMPVRPTQPSYRFHPIVTHPIKRILSRLFGVCFPRLLPPSLPTIDLTPQPPSSPPPTWFEDSAPASPRFRPWLCPCPEPRLVWQTTYLLLCVPVQTGRNEPYPYPRPCCHVPNHLLQPLCPREVVTLRSSSSRSSTRCRHVERRVRETGAGGDHLSVHYSASTAAFHPTVHCLLNSVVSDHAFFGTIDLTDFYLGTPSPHPQFIKIYIAS